jgi:hypothetical protein
MKKIVFATVMSIAAAGVTMAAFAPPSDLTSLPSQTAAAAPQRVTVVGCVQKESDYRKAKDAGRGGAAGTGIGAGNEFVLVAASMSTGSAAGTAGTTGGSTAGIDYELTGPNEGQLTAHVGKRVEITGMLKTAETSAGRPTGGATAGPPPAGVDVMSKDLKLRELEVSSVREASGTCPAMP